MWSQLPPPTKSPGRSAPAPLIPPPRSLPLFPPLPRPSPPPLLPLQRPYHISSTYDTPDQRRLASQEGQALCRRRHPHHTSKRPSGAGQQRLLTALAAVAGVAESLTTSGDDAAGAANAMLAQQVTSSLFS
ncbi:hypothetical protein V8E36_008686 [Tilletia maclaganii]